MTTSLEYVLKAEHQEKFLNKMACCEEKAEKQIKSERTS